jgi:hypothetical protein
MREPAVFAGIFVLGEAVSFLIFKTVNYFFFGREWEFRMNLSVFKGNLERLFLFLSLVYNFPHALIAFGAIKVGTRIRPDEKITNDYFFVGNMISLLISILYYAIWRTAG